MKKPTKIGAAVALAGAFVLLPATAANAASANGSKVCYGTTYPRLTVDATGPGTLTWVNRLTAAYSSYPFPGGHSTNYSPYQQANWTASAPGFYSTPTASCI